MKDNRGHWYLLTGIVIGAALGLAFAWIIQPVQYTNTAPETLRSDYKDYYRSLIAAAYMGNGDLVRAKARLELLQDDDAFRVLAEQAQRTLAEGKPFEEARSLGMLAAALQNPEAPGSITNDSPTIQPQTIQSADNSLIETTQIASKTPNGEGESMLDSTSAFTTTATPLAHNQTSTALPTRTATVTPIAPFVLASKEQSCDTTFGKSLIQVFTIDAEGQPVAGVEIITTWNGGENHFYTGLKPDISLGYADFTMTPGITYTVQLAQGGQPVPGIITSQCSTSDGEIYWGNWILEFMQP